MANKINFTLSLANALSIVISKAKVLLALDKITDELYATEVIETNLTQIITSTTILINPTGLMYDLIFYKVGNKVSFRGTITNPTNNVVNGDALFLWKDTEFCPKPTNIPFFYKDSSNGFELYFTYYSAEVGGFIAPNSTITIGEFLTYIAKD